MIIDDINKLTGISKTNLELLNTLVTDIIAHNTLEGIMQQKNEIIIDIGIGDLIIKKLDYNLIYKFIPSIELEDKITKAYKNGKSPLKEKVNNTIGKRINNTYKNLF